MSLCRQTDQLIKQYLVEPKIKSASLKIFLAINILGFFIIVSCTKLDLGTEVRIKTKESYYIDYLTSFVVDSVRDYRCPIDVVCVWAGDVDIFITANEGSTQRKIMARLYSAQYNPVAVGNYKIKIIGVLPNLKAAEKPDPSLNRIVIRIDRN